MKMEIDHSVARYGGVEIEKEANPIAFRPAHGLLVRVLSGSIAQW